LFVLERLRQNGVVGPATAVRGRGASMQSYSGEPGHTVAAHSMPCQLLLDNQFLHQLRAPNGRRLGLFFQERVIRLFSRCTLQRRWVNGADTPLEWYNKPVPFVRMYEVAARHALAGHNPEDVFRAFTALKATLERDHLEQALDKPLGKRDLWDVTLMYAD